MSLIKIVFINQTEKEETNLSTEEKMSLLINCGKAAERRTSIEGIKKRRNGCTFSEDKDRTKINHSFPGSKQNVNKFHLTQSYVLATSFLYNLE